MNQGHNPSNPNTPTESPESPAATLSAEDGQDEFAELNQLNEAQSKLAEVEAKNAELAEQYLRAQAEVQNTRRRAEEDMSKARKFAVESFAESLLPVLDSLEAGLAIENASPEQLREGSEATLKQLKSALERNKVLEVQPETATKFDPNFHQAIGAVPAPEQDPNTIVSVLQKGYTINDRVLRPALVMVSQSS